MRSGTIKGVRTLLLAAYLAAASAGPAMSQTVQKCIAADGHVTLTSGACGEGQRLAGTYDAVPEPPTFAPLVEPGRQAASDASGPAAARHGAARNRHRGPAASARVRTTENRCQAARDRRDRTLRRVGLKRTFDLLRKLDDEVWAACRS